MKKIHTHIFLFSLLFLMACSDSKKEEPAAGTAVDAGLPAAGNVTADSAVAAPASPAQMPDAASQPVTAVSAAPATEGMNPAHGEPGHRCDIPVGAPLNSPPGPKSAAGQTPPAPTEISVSPPSTPVQTSSAPTAPGMNPPHGQPGHDCAIPVGAPLKK